MLLNVLLSALPTSAWAASEVRDEIVVEAERKDVHAGWDGAASVSVFEIGNRTPTSETIASLVGQAPGVHIQQFGTADSFSGVSIRGSTLRQVSVYLDGIPLNPDGGQVVNLAEWPIRAMKRIEVYRGNAPAYLGGAAMGGAINLVSANDAVPVTGGASTDSTKRYSIDGYHQGKWSLFGRPQTMTLFNEFVVGQGQYTYFSDNGTPFNRTDDRRLVREHNGTASAAGLFRWSTRLGEFDLALLDSWLRKGQELPGHINNPSRHARLDLQRNLFGFSVQRLGQAKRFEATGWFAHRKERYDDRANELGLDAQWGQQTNQNVGLRIHQVQGLNDWLALGLTLGSQTDQPAHLNLLNDVGSTQPSRWMNTATVEAPLSVGRLAITPVGHTTWMVHPNQERTTYYTVDPRLGTRYRLSKSVTLRGNGGRYLRAPTTTELYGDRGHMVGNADLLPERGWQWDVGSRARWQPGPAASFSADIGHFWNASQDRITWVQNGQNTLRPMNFGRTWVQGLEASFEASVATQFAARTGLTWSQSRNLSTAPSVANNQLPGVPTWTSATSTTWTHPSDRLHVGHTYRYTAGNFWDATNWYRAAPRQFHDLFLQWRLRRLQLELGAENVFNKLVDVVPQNPLRPNSGINAISAVTDFSGHPLPGRTLLVGLRWLGGEK